MLKAGDRAPEFTLTDHTGSEVTLTNLLHQGPLILFFYPRDFTPVCTKEARMVRDLSAEITEVGLQAVGISPDDADSHQRFRSKHELQFTLLCDPEKHVADMFGVIGPFGVGLRRGTFLIDQNRNIQNAICADLRVGRHEEFLRRAIILREAAHGHRGNVET
jgi:peroxiredoxin Q/BCP